MFSKGVITFVIASQPISREISQILYPLYLQLLTFQKQSKELGLVTFTIPSMVFLQLFYAIL